MTRPSCTISTKTVSTGSVPLVPLLSSSLLKETHGLVPGLGLEPCSSRSLVFLLTSSVCRVSSGNAASLVSLTDPNNNIAYGMCINQVFSFAYSQGLTTVQRCINTSIAMVPVPRRFVFLPPLVQRGLLPLLLGSRRTTRRDSWVKSELVATTIVSPPSRVLSARCNRAVSGSVLCGGLLDLGGERKFFLQLDQIYYLRTANLFL